jgi:hypothetical protein
MGITEDDILQLQYTCGVMLDNDGGGGVEHGAGLEVDAGVERGQHICEEIEHFKPILLCPH